MALKFISGCGDHLLAGQKTMKWDVFQDCPISINGGEDGNACFSAGLTAYTRVRALKKIVLNPLNQVIFGARNKFATSYPLAGGTTYVVAAIHYGAGGAYSEATKQLSLNIDTTGHLYVVRGGWAGTVLGTSAIVFPAVTWKYLEVKAVVHQTTGSVEVRVDDVVHLNLSGIDTQDLGSSSIDAVEYIPWAVDDVYIMDLTATTDNPYITFLGKNLRVLPVRMSSIGLAQWTPPSGLNNVQAINDITPANTYSESRTIGNTDLFVPESLPVDATTILAVQSNLIGRKLDAMYSVRIADVADISGTPYAASYHEMTLADTDHLTLRAVAPDDGLAWTRTKYNASRRGFRRVA
jgi:hypothetical protein